MALHTRERAPRWLVEDHSVRGLLWQLMWMVLMIPVLPSALYAAGHTQPHETGTLISTV